MERGEDLSTRSAALKSASISNCGREALRRCCITKVDDDVMHMSRSRRFGKALRTLQSLGPVAAKKLHMSPVVVDGATPSVKYGAVAPLPDYEYW